MQATTQEKKREIVAFFLRKGILISDDLLDYLDKEENTEKIYEGISSNDDVVFLNKDLALAEHSELNVQELERSLVLAQRHKKERMYTKFLGVIKAFILWWRRCHILSLYVKKVLRNGDYILEIDRPSEHHLNR